MVLRSLTPGKCTGRQALVSEPSQVQKTPLAPLLSSKAGGGWAGQDEVNQLALWIHRQDEALLSRVPSLDSGLCSDSAQAPMVGGVC